MDQDRERMLLRGDIASKREKRKAFELRMDMVRDKLKNTTDGKEYQKMRNIQEGSLYLYNKYKGSNHKS